MPEVFIGGTGGIGGAHLFGVIDLDYEMVYFYQRRRDDV
jgi:hypothetical protein